jgi:uncharacterized protein (TIGR02284 family)
METISETIEILNDLIEINNDRIKGYEMAAKELPASESGLKTLFMEMIRQSHDNKVQLTEEVQVLGADAENSTTTSGKLYRAWTGLKAVFTGENKHAILSNCEGGEDAAQAAYKSALRSSDLPAFIRTILTEQQANLKLSHDKIKSLRDAEN